MSFWNRLFGRKQPEPLRPAKTPSVLCETPDVPVPFGFKSCWFAVKGEDTREVCEALGLSDTRAANWETGVRFAYDQFAPRGDIAVFITPPVAGWTLVLTGLELSADSDDGVARIEGLLSALSRHFGECQYFGSYRVVDHHAWFRAANGRVERGFSVADGSLFANIGDADPDEIAAIGTDLSGLDEDGFWDKLDEEDLWLDEETPMRVAARWSVDPTALPNGGPALGIAGLARF